MFPHTTSTASPLRPEITRPLPVAADAGQSVIAVDRVRCTGHGVCGQTLPGAIRLDEWGYPILVDPVVDRREGDVAIRLCPARALYRDERS